MAPANQATSSSSHQGLLEDGPNTPRRRRILQKEATRLTDFHRRDSQFINDFQFLESLVCP
eukprot:5884558-Karenia_brevis.AAC.1